MFTWFTPTRLSPSALLRALRSVAVLALALMASLLPLTSAGCANSSGAGGNPLTGVALSPATASLAAGESVSVGILETFSDGSTAKLTETAFLALTWTSSDATIATVDANGKVVAKKIGVAKITATEPTTAVTGTSTITVTAATVKQLAVTPPTASIPNGTTQAFVATATMSDATTVDVSNSVAWSTSDVAVAAIDATGLATGKSAGTATITASDKASGVTATAELTVTTALLKSIALTPAAKSIPNGTTQALVATGTFSDGTTKDISASVDWSSSDPTIATVSNASADKGTATGAAPGAVTIKATDAATTLTGSTGLTVTAAVLKSIAVTPAAPSIPNGTTKQFTATGTYSDSTTKDLTATVTWSSSTASVATVSNAAGSIGLASGASPGSATITATDSTSTISGGTTLTVTAAVLKSIAVTPAAPSIPNGTTKQFTATATYSDGSTKDLSSSATWSSSTPGVASISNAAGSHGLATAATTGTVTVTATDPSTSISGTATLTVTAAVLRSVAVTPATPSIPKGTAKQFAATGTYSDGTTKDLTTSVTWSSSAAGVASVSNAAGSNGLATGASTGTATITATDPASSISGTTTLTITAALLKSIAVTPATPSVAKGNAQAFVATGTYSDSTTKDLTTSVTWSSSSGAVASISNALGSEGLATGLTIGTVTVTATDSTSGLSTTTTATISNAVLASITITPGSPTLNKGKVQQFRAVGTYTDGTTQNLTESVTWSSSALVVASISNAAGSEGLATALTSGTATITAFDPSSLISGSTLLTIP